jgi:hypothetical protein
MTADAYPNVVFIALKEGASDLVVDGYAKPV